MQIKIQKSFVKKMFNLYLFLIISIFAMHEILTNKNLLKREFLFAKDIHNITSTALDVGLIAYSGSVMQSALISQNVFVASMTISLILVEIIKNVVKKERPDKSDKKSFPSGHTAIAFVCCFWIFISGGGKNYLFVLPALLIATMRILAKKHDIYDVSGGASIAILTCTAIYKIGTFLTKTKLNKFIKFV